MRFDTGAACALTGAPSQNSLPHWQCPGTFANEWISPLQTLASASLKAGG